MTQGHDPLYVETDYSKKRYNERGWDNWSPMEGNRRRLPHSHPTTEDKSHLGQELNCERWQIYKITEKYVRDFGVCAMKNKTDIFNHMKM